MNTIKKKYLIIGLLAVLSVSGSKVATAFELKGKVTNYPNKIIYLITGNPLEKTIIDSCVVKDGNFLFTGSISEPTAATLADNMLCMNNISQTKYIPFYIDESKMELSAEWPKEMSREKMPQYKLTGSLTDNEAKEYMQLVYSDPVKSPESNIKITKEFIKTHPDSYFSTSILSNYSSHFQLEEIESLYAGLSDKAKNYSVAKEILKIIETLKSVQPGKPAFDFSTTDINGNSVKLSDFRGKTVLLDFWASWCKPCRASMPHVKELYQKYHSKGLEVICIADNDSQGDAWEKAIKADGTGDFIHVLRGLKKLDNGNYDKSNDISERYYVHSIPSKFIVNANGILECVKAEDEMLDTKLKEIFGF